MPDASDDVEARARAIAATAKHVRKPLPRSVWIVALMIGVGCTIGALVVWLAPAGSAVPPVGAAPASVGAGRFGLGLAIGLAAGGVVGFAVGRRRS